MRLIRLTLRYNNLAKAAVPHLHLIALEVVHEFVGLFQLQKDCLL